MTASLGKVLVLAGVLLVLFGLVLWLARPGFLGRLPGDLRFEGRRFVVYVPLATSLLLSVLLTLLWNGIRRK
jgi:hypothetical protein